MENTKSLKFKTNINCSGCIEKVTPYLNKTAGIQHWSVDTSLKEKILTVELNGASANDVIHSVQQAGFKIEAVY